MTESVEQRGWIKTFNNGMFCEDTKIYWLIATKRMGYNVSFNELGGIIEVCITVPTNDITRIEY